MQESDIRFLNVDLDLHLESGLTKLLEYFEQSVVVLHRTGPSASIELGANYESLEDTITNYMTLVESLSPAAKDLWNKCTVRCMNIDLQGGMKPRSAAFTLSHRSISNLSAVGCSIEITVYAPLPNATTRAKRSD